MIKKYIGKIEVKIIKELGITNKTGKWVQVEILSGPDKGMRKPASTGDIKEISEST